MFSYSYFSRKYRNRIKKVSLLQIEHKKTQYDPEMSSCYYEQIGARSRYTTMPLHIDPWEEEEHKEERR